MIRPDYRDFISHSAKRSVLKKNKYIKKENNKSLDEDEELDKFVDEDEYFLKEEMDKNKVNKKNTKSVNKGNNIVDKKNSNYKLVNESTKKDISSAKGKKNKKAIDVARKYAQNVVTKNKKQRNKL